MREQRWTRVIPVAFVMYTIAFIDRTNISLALPSISRSLRMTPAEAGSAAGIFFWGYLVLQIPGGYLAQKWSAKRFIMILLVVWGMCAVVTGFVHTGREFLLMRFLLGVAEGGVWPATLVLLAHWFPSRERARANAYWMLCLPVAVVVSSPLSGWILGRWNWRALLVVEGVFPLIWLAIWGALIHDHPHQAPWISAGEKEQLELTLAQESAELIEVKRESYVRSLLRPGVLLMVAIYFLMTSGDYGFLFWLPTAMEKTRRMGNLEAGLLFSVPYLITVVGMVLISRHSDKAHERRRHITFGLAWGAVFMTSSVLAAGVSPVLSFMFIAVVGAGSYGALGPFWAIPTETLPASVAGPAMGVVNAFGNLGGYFGPLTVGYLRERTGGFVYPFAALGVFLLASATLALFLPKKKLATKA
ncbi:MAG: MFS transporter [Terriglobia bacterium]